MLERRIKDPRLGFVTVTDTRLTNDLREATVFYTVFGTDAERADSAAALDSAKGVIRSEVGKRTGVRHTPSLTFVPDAIPENARQIDDLLERARRPRTASRRSPRAPGPPGEAEPYRKPRTGGGDDYGDEKRTAGRRGMLRGRERPTAG